MEEDSPWGDEVGSRTPSIAEERKPTAATEAPNKTASPESKKKPAPIAAGRPGKRVVRKFNPQSSTTLEALDDSLGPLGPLGDNAASTPDTPPAPPLKETPAFGSPTAQRTSPQHERSSLRNMMESVDLGADDLQERDGRSRIPPPVEAAFGPGPQRATPSSVSVEQAAKPKFDIAVGDPHKVGDLTSSHTVYQVRTKVGDQASLLAEMALTVSKTTSKAYRIPEFTVSRRYRDFLWLYNQLHHNSPGVVVPPPPEKQAVGRFDHNFVESRRQALEKMLVKITSHPILQHDGDLKLFLESESFNIDIKHKERKDVGLPETKGGMLSSIGLSVGGGSKFIEHDDWFHDRRIYLDALENQLKALLKSTDAVVAQRKALAESCADLSNSLHALAAVELSPALSAPLDGLSDVQLRIRDLYDRQAQQDMLTLGIVIDEYIRLIGSVKTAFGQRQKAFHAWHAAESSLAKLKASQEKLLRAGRTQQDRLGQMQADVADSERRVHQARLLFDDMGRHMRNELDRFEREKVEDFKSGVETFLESAVEAQKELIEIWETYLVQLDADEEGVTPFVGGHGEESHAEQTDAYDKNGSAGPEGDTSQLHSGSVTDGGSTTAVGTSTGGDEDRGEPDSSRVVAAQETEEQ